MEKMYAQNGISFHYPEDWKLNLREQEQEISIIVDSPQTSFWGLTLFFDLPQSTSVIDSAIHTFQEEYGDIDIYPSPAEICQRETIARNLEFICVEMITCAFLRAFQTDRFTALVLFQATDHELNQMRPLLERIGDSLECGNAAADPVQ